MFRPVFLQTNSDLLAVTKDTEDDLLTISKDTEYVEEEVEDVKIEVDGSVDVFFRGYFVHHHVGVVDDEEGE